MQITISTPALLFPAVSLLLLAYTNRFLAVASLIRLLSKQIQEKDNCKVTEQIKNLKNRLELIPFPTKNQNSKRLYCDIV
jgi:hypothetical protein